MSNPAIKTSGLTKIFAETPAVDGLNLNVQEGEIFAFLGPNGAGKTTTVKLLTGLLKPDAGGAEILGKDVFREPIQAKKLTGYVSDQPFVYQYLTGFEFVKFVADIYRVPQGEQKEKIPELFEMFELSSVMDDLVESYSHGMKQKLVLASVLLHKPKVIFLDEPLVGLDPKSARLVKEIFSALSKKGTTVFMCTHVLEIAEKTAHRVGIIQNGRLITTEKVSDLKKKAKENTSLEDIFLELTGGREYAGLLKYL
jgi:ABC-2 type transport system ATP-binding protein